MYTLKGFKKKKNSVPSGKFGSPSVVFEKKDFNRKTKEDP